MKAIQMLMSLKNPVLFCLKSKNITSICVGGINNTSAVNGSCAYKSLHTSLSRMALGGKLRTKKKTALTAASKTNQNLDDETQEADGVLVAGVNIPTLETHVMLINGVPYKELPIANVAACHNNTKINLTTHAGNTLAFSSCGIEGFFNTKQNNTVAAQAVGISVGNKGKKQGISHVRVVLKGIGIGRLAAVTGLKMAGMNVVSISDITPYPERPQRARKQRRT